jgi:hypothetical protein
VSLDKKVITKHHRTKERKTHTKRLLCCFFFCSFYFFSFFLLQLFFDNFFFRGTSKVNSRTEMLLMSNWPHSLFPERVGQLSLSLSLSQKYGLLGFKQKVYLDWSSKGLLGFKQKLYSDWSTRSNQTRKYDLLQQGVYNNEEWCTQSQTQCVLSLGLERKGVIRLGYKHKV